MKAMVLAAGEGTRLRPLTLRTPKPMIPIANIPLLERTLRWLAREGVEDVVINLHHRPEAIQSSIGDGKKHGLAVEYSLEETLLGTAGAVKRCQELLGPEPFAVIYGDNLLDISLRELQHLHAHSGAEATIGLFHAEDPTACGLVLTDEEGRVTRFQEKPPPEEVFTNCANAGVYILDPSVLDVIPDHGPSDFGKDVFPMLLGEGRHLHAVLVNGYLQDTGTPENYRRVNEDALLGKFPGARGRLVKNPPSYTLIGQGARFAPDVTFRGINVIGAKARIESNAILTNCIVWDNAVIGENVGLTDALIGYGAMIRANSQPPEGLRLGDGDVFPDPPT